MLEVPPSQAAYLSMNVLKWDEYQDEKEMGLKGGYRDLYCTLYCGAVKVFALYLVMCDTGPYLAKSKKAKNNPTLHEKKE